MTELDRVAEDWQKRQRRKLLPGRIWTWATPILAFGLILSYLAELPEDRWPYAMWYSVDLEHVQIQPKPGDCDFLYAPIGFKGCRYGRVIQVSHEPTAVYVLWERDKD